MPWRPLPLTDAVAVYPFQHSTQAELPLRLGDQLYLIEEGGKDDSWCRGYLVAPPLLASALTNEGRTASGARVYHGIFPRSFLEIRETLGGLAPQPHKGDENGHAKPPAPVPMLKIGDESPTSLSEPLVDEISSCLREWYTLHLPDRVRRRQYDVLEEISVTTGRLDYARRQLLNNVLTLQERSGVRDQAVWDLVRGNKLLSGEVIVRDAFQNGRLLTAHDSAIQMSRLQTIMGTLDTPPVDKVEVTTLHHALLEVQSVAGSSLDTLTLNICLYEKTGDGKFFPFSEVYSASASSKIKTVLADLNARDIGADDHLYLVVKVIALEPPKLAPKSFSDRPPSRNGTLKGAKDQLLTRRRSSLMFGSKRKAAHERPHFNQNGRTTPQPSERAETPTIPEEPEDENAQKPTGPPVQRLVGVGLLDVAPLLRSTEKAEGESITIWSPCNRSEEKMYGSDTLVT